jgi:hypothetical protein
MKQLLEKYKSVSKPMQIFVGIMIAFFIIAAALSGYLFGVWLKKIL